MTKTREEEIIVDLLSLIRGWQWAIFRDIRWTEDPPAVVAAEEYLKVLR